MVDDNRLAIGNVVDYAPVGFTIFRGPAVTPGDNNSDYWSRYFMPDASRCVVDSKSTGFYCYWPERDQKETVTRATDLIQRLLACNNFPQISKLESPPVEINSLISMRTTIRCAGKADIGVSRTKLKSDDRHTEEWFVRLDVERQIRR
jgi:hypothetical protein